MVSELLGSKIRFTILLPFISCYHSIFFRLCFIPCSCFVLCTKLKKKRKKKEVILKQQILSFYLLKVSLFLNCDFCSFRSLEKKKNLIFFFPHWLVVLSYIFYRRYWFKYCKLNFLTKFVSSRRTEKGKLWVEKGKRVWD